MITKYKGSHGVPFGKLGTGSEAAPFKKIKQLYEYVILRNATTVDNGAALHYDSPIGL
jgi:hypothetical protein